MNYVEGIKIGGTTAAQIPCIKHKGIPTTETVGAVGCLYMNTDTGGMYKCIAVKDGKYIWLAIVNGYYSTTREEVGELHDNIKASYIWGLYDALKEKYPGKVQRKEHTNNDGTFTNYEYVISTGEYSTEGIYAEAYGCDPQIKKPKYLVLNAIHGTERKTTLSTYRFVCDVLSGHNVPLAFREGAIISVMPVGTPSAFDAFTRQSDKAVDINRNFGWNWEESQRVDEYGRPYTYGESATSEKETQAITNWLTANSDAELFIDFHNSGALNEKVVVIGVPNNSTADTARKVALRGVDRIIPFWRDVIGYPDKVEASKMGVVEERDVIFSYSASTEIGGLAFAYAQNILGIRSIAIETASHYGNHSEWDTEDGKKTYSPEAIAMGAEALGNILIEFYAQSCEVIEMNGFDSKLNKILEGVTNGFRIESGVIELTEDQISSPLTFRVPCSNGAKALFFHADSDTMAKIQSHDYTTNPNKYVCSVIGALYATADECGIGIKCTMNAMADYTSTGFGWVIAPGQTTCKNEDGFTFNCYALKAGKYNWTAYYWNDKEE